MPNFSTTEIPSKHEQKQALEFSQLLSNYFNEQKDSKINIKLEINNVENISATLPANITEIFLYILEQTADGNAVTVATQYTELSTQQAADLLNVSRPYLILLLEQGNIPHHKVGSHRRVLFSDVVAYKELSYTKRRSALDELTRQAQELNMGY